MATKDLPIFEDRIELRLAQPSDVGAFAALYSLSEVVRYQLFTAEQFREMLLDSVDHKICSPGITTVFAIVLREQQTVIGDCQLTVESPESRQAQIGFSLHPAHWGNGYATSAVRGLLRSGFESLGLHRIYAATDTRNDRCWRLLDRVGFRREAHFRHEYFIEGEWVDSFVYAMLEDEWRAQASEAL